MYEGARNCPEPDRFWSIIDRHQVSVFYTAPTVIRADGHPHVRQVG
jgi:acetyl-CoA synthetase